MKSAWATGAGYGGGAVGSECPVVLHLGFRLCSGCKVQSFYGLDLVSVFGASALRIPGFCG